MRCLESAILLRRQCTAKLGWSVRGRRSQQGHLSPMIKYYGKPRLPSLQLGWKISATSEAMLQDCADGNGPRLCRCCAQENSSRMVARLLLLFANVGWGSLLMTSLLLIGRLVFEACECANCFKLPWSGPTWNSGCGASYDMTSLAYFLLIEVTPSVCQNEAISGARGMS